MAADDEALPNLAGDVDFAALFEASAEPRVFKTGQAVEGVVVLIGRDVVFIDVGGKSEATMDIPELRDDEGELTVALGDTVEGVVVSTGDGVKLSRKLAQKAANRRQLEDAYHAGLPVEGRVEEANKGGYDVRIGGQRAFCPISQIERGFTTDPEEHVGQIYTFKITEYAEDGRNVVVSRRALIEDVEREQEADVRKTIVPGADLPGRVASVRPYGAFVDLGGGIQGLLHVSEMGWSRVSDPATVVQPGDEITVRVLGVDNEQGKISLGTRQLQPDPWARAGNTYAAGQRHRATVTRIADFGVFVEIEPGIEALAHLSTFPPSGRRDAWRDSVTVDEPVDVDILSVDVDKKRIGVAVAAEGSAPAVALAAGARVTGTVHGHERYGVFVFLGPGRIGLLPNEETDTPHGTDLTKRFPIGSDIVVVVLEIDAETQRIRLSRKAIRTAEERDDAEAYASRQDAAQENSFGSMADKLRAAFNQTDT